MAFLIVDEYQDLNPLDIKLVDLIAADGVGIFAAGDDDQSIYSFRFAAPGGIQDFTARHPGAGDHVLEGCFRCATSVVSAADTLIEHFSPGSRIPKTLESLWSTSLPPASGYVSRWRVPTGAVEAELVAESVRRLIDANVPPKNVMILLSNKRVFPAIRAQLIAKGIPFTPPRESTWTDTDGGRFVLGLLRALSDTGDYMALRLILGCRRQVGVRTCAGIVRKVTDNLLNYRALFFAPLPAGVFGSREMSALLDARAALAAVDGFDESDELQNRAAVIRRLLVDARSESEAAAWDDLMTVLPAESTLEELRDYLAADNEEQQETVLSAIFARLDQPIPPGLPEPRVRVMTMHGAKGLQADVVFIPALEEQILPGPRRAMSPGLVLEGARLLYVSMTRARAGLVMSLSRRRMWQGRSIAVSPSRYASHVGGAFVDRGAPLSAAEARDIADLASLMRT
jgi:DNA helicase-2/ATP-dependent DNA helicase PcrA